MILPKWLLPVAAIVVLVLAVGAIWLTQSKAPANTNSFLNANANGNANANANVNAEANVNEVANTNGTSNTNTPTIPAGWNTYTNAEYHFTLAFPHEWDGYTVTIDRNKEFTDYQSNTTRADIITFYHPKRVSDKGNPGVVDFSIEVYRDPTLPFASQRLLGTRGETRYGFTIGNGAAPDEMAALYDLIAAIRDTFQLQ